MKLSRTAYDHNYHGALRGYCAHGYSIFHSVHIFNSIVINEKEYHVSYESGASYCCHYMKAPTNELAVDHEFSHHLCNLLDELYESDFDSDENIAEKLKEIQEIDSSIETVNDLFILYEFFNDNKPCIWNIIDQAHTDNIDDYEEDEEGLYWVLKKQREEN